MVKKVDYESRRKAVLSETINKYIKEALPIASEDISKGFNLSPATLRNIFADLEKSGYLTHPYTSAGRVPTDKGYRYYVDYLISQIGLLDEEKKSIINEYKKEIRRLDDALEKTSEIISAITHYTSIVSFLDWQDKFFYKGISFVLEQPEFQDSLRIRLLIKVIEDKERLLDILHREFNEKFKVYIGEELSSLGMDNCSLVVLNYRTKKRPLGHLAVLGPKRMDYSHIISTLEYVSDILAGTLDGIFE